MKVSEWRKEYLDILTSKGLPADKELASELIEGGYAKGIQGGDSFAWSGVTVKGRVLAESLKKNLYEESLLYKIKNTAIALLFYGAGIFSSLIVNWIKT